MTSATIALPTGGEAHHGQCGSLDWERRGYRFGYKVCFKRKKNPNEQHPLKQPQKSPQITKAYSSFGPRHEHVDLEPKMAACFHTTVCAWHCTAMALREMWH